MFQDKIKNFLNSVGKGVSNTVQTVVKDTNPYVTPQVNSDKSFGSILKSVAESPIFAGRKVVADVGNLWTRPTNPFPVIDVRPTSTVGNIAQTAFNLPANVLNSVVGKGVAAPVKDVVLNASRAATNQLPLQYSELNSPQAKLGYQVAGLKPNLTQGLNTVNNGREVLVNIGGSVEPVATAYVPKGAGEIAQVGFQGATKQVVRELITQGAKQGGLLGGIQGLATGLDQGRTAQNNDDFFKQVLLSAGTSTVAGGLLGGVAAGVPASVGKAINVTKQKYMSLHPQASAEEAEQVARKFIRDEFGRFTKNPVVRFAGEKPQASGAKFVTNPNNPSQLLRTDAEELRMALGMPREGIKFGQMRSGKINFDEIANLVKGEGEKPASVKVDLPTQVVETSDGQKLLRPNYDVPSPDVPSEIGKLGSIRNSEMTKRLSGLKDQLLVPSRNILKNMGEAGTEAAAKIDNYYNNAERYSGGAVADYNNAIKTLGNNRIEKVLRFLDGQQVQLDPVESEAATKLRGILNVAAGKAESSKLSITRPSGEKVPFAPINNYLPHIVDVEKIKALREPTIRHFVDSGQMSLQNATQFVDQIISGKSVADAYERVFPGKYPQKFGNLEFSRILDWNKDVLRYDKKLLPDYFTGAFKRISNAEQFGPSNELLDSVLTKINQEGGDPRVVEQILNRNLGLEKKNQAFEQGVSAMKQLQATSKLGLSAISNTGQSVNTATVYGVGPTVKAMLSAGKPEAQEFALRSGAILEDSLKALDEKGLSDGILSKITAPGMGKVERFNRVVAANAGKDFAVSQFNKLVGNPTNKAARQALEKFGVNVDEALNAGKLSEEDLLKSAQKAVNTTQFKTRAIDLPPEWTSTWGRLMTQFKNFSYKQSEFLLNEVLKPAKQGNLLPLSRYLLLGLAAGEVIGDTKALLRGRERPTDLKERALDNLATVGGYGLLQDALSNFSRGSDAALQFMTGPTLGDVAKAGSGFAQLAGGNAKPLAKFAVGNIPIIGQTAKTLVFPTKQAYKARTADTLTDTLLPTLLGGGQGMNALLPGVNGNEKFNQLISSLKAPEKAAPHVKVPSLVDRVTADKVITPTEKEEINATLKDLRAQRKDVLNSSGGLFNKGLTTEEKDARLTDIDNQIKKLTNARSGKVNYNSVDFTGEPEIDNALLRKKLGDITTQKNAVLKDFADGKVTLDEANKKILELKSEEKSMKTKVSGGRKRKVKSASFSFKSSVSRPIRYSTPRSGLKLSGLKYSKQSTLKFSGFKYKKTTFRYK